MNPKQTIIQQKMLSVAHHDFNKGLNLHAFFRVNSHETGEDLVQETFLKTWKYLVRGGKIDIIKPFLYHVLNNLIVDEYRKKKAVSLDVLAEDGFDPSPNESESEKLFDILDGKTASLLIQKLPETYVKIMRMRFIQDLTLKEISLITGETKNAIAVKVHRGLEKLKILYKSPAMVV